MMMLQITRRCFHVQMAVSWDVASCNLLDTDRRFRGVVTAMVEVGRYVPDYMAHHRYSYLRICSRENVKSR